MTRTAQIEQARQVAQVRLDGLKNAKERNELGQFATPQALALEITSHVRELWGRGDGKVRFLDPGIGTGSFFSALQSVFPSRCIANASGVELDRGFASAAAELWGTRGLTVIQGDFTKLSPPSVENRANLIITNPPYVRHHHLGAEEKERLQRAVARSLGIRVSGLAGLYCYFLLLAHEWLSENGLSVWLIPSEFMDVNYGTAIKEYLTEHVTLLRIHRYHEQEVKFDDALVTSAVVVFRKRPPEGAHEPVFTYGGSLAQPMHREAVSLAALRELHRKWSNYPIAARNGRSAKAGVVSLGDLFTIKRGIATGANGFFIMPRAEALERGLPSEFLRPILPSPRHLESTVIEGDEDGYPRLETQLALVDCSLPERVVRERYSDTLWRFLEAGRKEGIPERYLPSRRTPWYSQEQRPPAPFLCTYMGRNRSTPFRFFWNRSKATAANVFLLLYPKGPLAAALDADPSVYARTLEHLQQIKPEDFFGEGRVYGGGLFKMEPRELTRLSARGLVEALPSGRLGPQSRLHFS